MKALAIQGGSLRSVFTAGVFDAFMAFDYDPFEYKIGVSSGSICMSYYFTQQYKAVYTLTKELAQDTNFISFRNFLSEEGYMNLSYMENYSQKKIPLDIELGMQKINSGKQVEIVTTNLNTGKTIYFEPNADEWLRMIKASSTLPYITKGSCKLQGLDLMDGGWTDPIPVKRAIEKGGKEILVIRTHPLEYRQTQRYIHMIGSYFHRDNPAKSKMLGSSHEVYNITADFLEQKHKDVKIVQLAPKDFLETYKNPTSLSALEHDYREGLEVGIDYLKSDGKI